MEASNVYFTSFKATDHQNLLQKLHRLMKTAGFETIDFTDKYAAIKIHFEWKSCIAHAVKIGLGSDQYKLITIQLGIFVDSWTKGGHSRQSVTTFFYLLQMSMLLLLSHYLMRSVWR